MLLRLRRSSHLSLSKPRAVRLIDLRTATPKGPVSTKAVHQLKEHMSTSHTLPPLPELDAIASTVMRIVGLQKGAARHVAEITLEYMAQDRAELQSRQPAAPVATVAPVAAAAVPVGWRLVPVEFIRGVTTLAHNYSLKAEAPFYYQGVERDAFSAAYARCGQDLAKVVAMLQASPTPPVQQVSAAKVAAEALRRASLLQTCIDHKQFQSASALVDALTLWLSSLTATQAEGERK
jgi:hypothetical protein